MKNNRKVEIVSFKVDSSLRDILQQIPNRSEFIRNAVLSALESVCPVCSGTGILSPQQKEHWENFSQTHHVQKCDDCKELHIVCDNDQDQHVHA